MQKSAFKLKFHDNCMIFYRGTYEKHFLDLCYEKNIDISSFDGKLFYYENNKKRRYYPDFYHKKSNTIIEIKSTYTFNYNISKNLLKKDCVLNNGYNFLFIIDKNYEDFLSII